MNKKPAFSLKRVKDIMQESEDIGRISKEGIQCVGRAAELLIKELTKDALSEAEESGGVDVKMSHLENAIGNKENYSIFVGIKEDE